MRLLSRLIGLAAAAALCCSIVHAAAASRPSFPYPLLHGFEEMSVAEGCTWSGKVEPAEPSAEARHSGQDGLRLHYAGSEPGAGSQYMATWSDMLGVAQGLSFWLYVKDNPGPDAVTVTVSSMDYQVQWHHRLDLNFQGWKQITLFRQDFTAGGPAGRAPDWGENYIIYFLFSGPAPLTPCAIRRVPHQW